MVEYFYITKNLTKNALKAKYKYKKYLPFVIIVMNNRQIMP
jgi:hypothetical protein